MASIEHSEDGMPKHSGIADLIVKGAITLVTAAFFVGAYLQFQMSFWGALGAALGVYIMLLLGHFLMRRKERESVLEQELYRLEDEVARLKVAPQPVPGPGASATRIPKMARPVASAPPPPPVPAARVAPPMPPPGPAPAMAPVMPTAAIPPAMPPVAAAVPPAAPIAAQPPRLFRSASEAALDKGEPRFQAGRPGQEPAMSPTLGAGLSLPSQPPAPTIPGPSLSMRGGPALDDVSNVPTLPDWSAPAAAAPGDRKLHHDYWPSASKPTLPDGPRVELPTLQSDRETDLDAVQGMIKRLADEVNITAEPSLDGLQPQQQESVLRASLDALQTTASVMRSSKKKDTLPGISGVRPAGPTPPPIMPSHAKLAALAEAVSAGRVEVSLTPIVGLADHQVHYYEVFACPRDERGALLATTTRDPQLAIAGLLPLLDSARLKQAAQVARSFAEGGRGTYLFTPATAVSLANDGFLDELADAYRDREALANELVMTFAQADVRTFGGSEWSALTDMRDLGFRFGVEDVTDFDYEFTALCAAGFAFVKLDAATLLSGLAGPDGTIGAEEVCRSLAELGLTLVVTGISDEATRESVAAAGVPLGQGPLFGAPLAVGANAFAAADHAAA
jgi:cyclic-di-GMP phosphodiesterase TipF (flagellum assembly factor)